MIRISVSEARKSFSDVVSRVEYAGERAILHRHGRETAALVPIVDVILLDLLEEQMDIHYGNVEAGRSYAVVAPPSTARCCPVIKAARLEERKATAAPVSSGSPRRPRGEIFSHPSKTSSTVMFSRSAMFPASSTNLSPVCLQVHIR